MHLDVSFPGGDLKAAAALARRWEELGIGRLWSAETQHDPFLPLAAATVTTDRIGLGTSIAIAFSRSPMAVANAAWDLQRASGGRFVLGLGTQVKAHNVRRFSVPWSAPVPRLREVVGALRAIWQCWQTGSKLSFHGEHYRFDLMTPFFDPGPIESPPPPIFLAAVNEHMARLAGEVADGLHVHSFHSARYITEVLKPGVADGLVIGDRRGAGFQLHARVFTVIGDTAAERARAREEVRRQIAFYASTRTYARVLAVHGWEEVVARLHELSLHGQWKSMASLITDEMLDVYAVTGTWDDIGDRVRARYAGLLDRVTLRGVESLPPADPRWLRILKGVAG
jgi:probable F420-dependent oxidoreductase